MVPARCPICGQFECWRAIPAYWRTVIELFPSYREAMIPVARFQCRATGLTFSLLPYQLAPYHIYTIESMVGLLALVWAMSMEPERKQGLAMCIVDGAPPSSRVSPWLLACWIRAFVVGLGRARHVLRRRYALDDLATDGGLREVAEHTEVLARDPPAVVSAWCWRRIGMPLVGTPSQHRCAS